MKIYPGLQHLGCCNILIAISALLPPFYSLQVEESKKGAGFNKHAGLNKRVGLHTLIKVQGESVSNNSAG